MSIYSNNKPTLETAGICDEGIVGADLDGSAGLLSSSSSKTLEKEPGWLVTKGGSCKPGVSVLPPMLSLEQLGLGGGEGAFSGAGATATAIERTWEVSVVA